VVGVLIRMKLTILRRAVRGPRAGNMIGGAAAGLTAAVATVAIARLDDTAPGTIMDLLAVVFAIWTLGWVLAPAYSGQPALRAEHFALQPVTRGRLALGLFGASLVGVGAVVTLVAFAAVGVFAAGYGGTAVLFAVPGVLLQLALVVLLSRLAAVMFGVLTRSRIGGSVSAVITAVMAVLASSGWIVFTVFDIVRETGFSQGFSNVFRALPSSWALVSVEAAGRSDWTWAVLPLAGLVVLIVLLVVVWGRLLGPQRLARPTVRGSTADRAVTRGMLTGGSTRAVFVKELRSWVRDPVRTQSLVFAPVFAALTALLPLVFDSPVFLPFMGAIAALMGAVTCVNLYGQDGTALWLTVLAPGTERSDVRGRQLAWLTMSTPLTVVLTVIGGLASGRPDLWPLAITATVAVLGGVAGLLPWLALTQLVPGPDPRAHRDSPLDHGDVTGLSIVMMLFGALTAAPAIAAAIAAAELANPNLEWVGVPAAVVTGLGFYWLFGRLAVRHLVKHGPELLYLMRNGKSADAKPDKLAEMSPVRRQLLNMTVAVGFIALFPQALVPTFMKLTGDIAQVWFLPLYLPAQWQWPMIAVMFVIGAGALLLAWKIYSGGNQKARG
jgi:hypothetical protein